MPETAWAPGIYNLLLNPALEDLAGNRLDQLFDVEAKSTAKTIQSVEKPFQIRFEIAPAGMAHMRGES